MNNNCIVFTNNNIKVVIQMHTSLMDHRKDLRVGVINQYLNVTPWIFVRILQPILNIKMH